MRPSKERIEARSPLLITYTSGSTGQPKGVIHTHSSVANIILQSVIGRGLAPDDIWYTAAASSWMTVLLNVQGIANGMSHVIMDGAFEIGRFMRDLERHRATAVMLVPTLIARAIEETRKRAYDMRSVRLLMYGSAPATPELIRAAYDTFGCDLVQSYGMTEGGWITQLSERDHRRAIDGEPHLLKSVGRAGAMSEIAICESDGTSVPAGQSGEIWVRGELLMQGYRNLPRETAEVFSNGWLKTNDIGRVDEQGYLYLQDRKNLLIITGAVNVFPSGVETVIREHPDVADVVVVGAPHPEWGEAVVAVVQTRGAAAPAPADIIAFAGAKLSRMECPKHVLFVDEFPLTVNGKINKVAVRSWVAEQKASLPWMEPAAPDRPNQAI
jgi:acyl-CoA synthetase (AMP-forming)/AMP-acid ligase II